MDSLNLIDKDIELNNTNDTLDELSLNEILSNKEPEMDKLDTVSIINEEISVDNNELVETEEEKCTALVELKPHSLLVAQTMFKKSIKISIKSFLISLSLGFLNLFF